MPDLPPESGPPTPSAGSDPSADFRWTAFFQRATEPMFVLNRRRQLLFVNHAWERLTGFAGRDVRLQPCKRQRDAEPGSPEAILSCLAPTREALEGRAVRVRRRVVHRETPPSWWDVEFFPLLGPHGNLGLIGKVRPLPSTEITLSQPLPEKLVALRQRLMAWWGLEHLPTEMPAMCRVAEQVRLASRSAIPVLLVGQPGTGKEWLARTIHVEGPNRDKPFIAVDCQHLPALALAHLLFEPRSLANRPGTTLYFKAPSLLPREIQARLCEQYVKASEDDRHPRWLAGSDVDLAPEVQAGRMLEEFHCLVSTLTIQVPPLRARLADMSFLVEQLLNRAQSGREHSIKGLTDEAWEVLRSYPWPGNLRELYAVLATACNRAKGERLEAGDLPWFLRSEAPVAERSLPLDETLEQVERRLIQLALATAKGNKSRAAELLEIPRPRLLRRLAALGLG